MSPLMADVLAYLLVYGGFLVLGCGLVWAICIAARNGDRQPDRPLELCEGRRHRRTER